jgi:hypothetical protein
VTAPTDNHVSPAALDAYEMGLTSEAEQASIEAHLGVCGRCADAQRTRKQAAERFLRDVLPRTAAAATARTQSDAAWVKRFVFVALPLAGATLFAFMATTVPREHQAPAPLLDPGADLGIKGVGFRVFARRGERVTPVASGARLRAGDAIRFVLEPTGMRYAMVASVDGRGRASVYVPFDGTESVAIDPGARWEAPGSVVLDAAPGPERLFLIVSAQPVSSDVVLDRLRSIGAAGAAGIRSVASLPLNGTAQASLLIEKEEAP